MRRMLFILLVFAFSLVSCSHNNGYVINGIVKDPKADVVLLLKNCAGVIDTLAKVHVIDGKFLIKGCVEHTTDAVLKIEGSMTLTPIFLENVEFVVHLNPTFSLDNWVKGTENHRIYNEYLSVAKSIMKESLIFKREINEAYKLGDTTKIRSLCKCFNINNSKARAKGDSLLKVHADSYVAAYLLLKQISGLNDEVLERKYNELGEHAKICEAGLAVADCLERLKRVSVGRVAPDFTLNTPQNTPLTMSSIKGKAKLIDFWASWCEPCRKQHHLMLELYEKFHEKGLEIISVSLDRSESRWIEGIEKDHLNWYHVSDLKYWNSDVAYLYAINSIPQIFLLDDSNKIIAKDLKGEKLRKKLIELFE